MAGYSGTPLIKKLGIVDGMKIKLINPPSDYGALIETDISKQIAGKNEKPDFIHLFATSEKEFEREMRKLKAHIKATTMIWVSWYKKSSGIPTDITEDTIRNYALQNDLVDIKVCAVNDVWSGLKLVIQKNKRTLYK